MRSKNLSDTPLSDSYAGVQDAAWVEAVQSGDKTGWEHLCSFHYPWIYNLALRMLSHPVDAEDASQEILIKAFSSIKAFRRDSSFRTWLYRIAVNHLLDRKRSRPETVVHDFQCYGTYLDSAATDGFSAVELENPETKTLIDEAKVSCLLGMLLCLDRPQRMAFLIGELCETSAALGGELMSISPANFRQLLHRARERINAFMSEKCGLLNPSCPCRCEKKTKAFIRDGIVDPRSLLFAGKPHDVRMRASLTSAVQPFEQSRERVAKDILNGIPFWNSADFDFLKRILEL